MFDQQVFCSFSPHSLASGFDFVLPFLKKKLNLDIVEALALLLSEGSII